LDGPVHGGAADVEEVGQFSSGVGAVVPQLHQVLLLAGLELGLLAAEPSLGLRFSMVAACFARVIALVLRTAVGL